MTDIDPQADIEFDSAADHVAVRVPLVGPVTGDWLDCYQKLARAAEVPAQVQAGRGRPWMVVRVPAGRDQAGVVATLDAACVLIAEADAAMRPLATAKPEASARDWWAARRGSAPGRPVSGLGGAGVRAEKRWPMACTLVLAMAVPLLLPARGVTGRLIVDLVEGGPETNSPTDLLKTGFLVWLYTILAFSFLYWVLDGGGPESRFLAPPQFPDLAFPERLNPGVGPPGWRPEFFDYLYLGLPTPPRSARPT